MSNDLKPLCTEQVYACSVSSSSKESSPSPYCSGNSSLMPPVGSQETYSTADIREGVAIEYISCEPPENLKELFPEGYNADDDSFEEAKPEQA